MYNWQLSDRATCHKPSTLSSVITDSFVKDKQRKKRGGGAGIRVLGLLGWWIGRQRRQTFTRKHTFRIGVWWSPWITAWYGFVFMQSLLMVGGRADTLRRSKRSEGAGRINGSHCQFNYGKVRWKWVNDLYGVIMQILICSVQKWVLNRSGPTFLMIIRSLCSSVCNLLPYSLSVTPGFSFYRYPAAFIHFSKSTRHVGRVKSFWSKEIIKNLTLTLYWRHQAKKNPKNNNCDAGHILNATDTQALNTLVALLWAGLQTFKSCLDIFDWVITFVRQWLTYLSKVRLCILWATFRFALSRPRGV